MEEKACGKIGFWALNAEGETRADGQGEKKLVLWRLNGQENLFERDSHSR